MDAVELAAGFEAYTDIDEMADEATQEEAPSLTVLSVSVVGTITWSC
jgi:hypothetical protein